MVTYCKNRSRIRHLKRSCSWTSTNQCSLLVPVIAPVINIVEAQRFRTTLAIIVKFTRLRRAYDFERELRENSELTRYKVELMYHYFGLRASQVILAVVETFLDLIIEFWDLVLSVRVLVSVKNSTFSLIEMHLMESEWAGVFVVDKSAVFAVSHQIADVYDQVHRLAFLD